jgi:hypothetical protein
LRLFESRWIGEAVKEGAWYGEVMDGVAVESSEIGVDESKRTLS